MKKNDCNEDLTRNCKKRTFEEYSSKVENSLNSDQHDDKSKSIRVCNESTTGDLSGKNHSFPFKVQTSRFYINKLQQYPKSEHLPSMLGFSDMFCKNPFFEYHGEKPNRSDVLSIFMTTYGYEIELLMPILKSRKHFVLANDRSSSDKQTKDIYYGYQGFENWTVIHPPKDSKSYYGGAFHPKLWLIKFDNFLRVVIGSGNLHICDWSVWSNCLWFQDFPLLSKVQQTQNSQTDQNGWDYAGDFENTLTELVISTIPNGVKSYQELLQINLSHYDYSQVEIILVSSIAGRSQQLQKYGSGKLSKISTFFAKQRQMKLDEEKIQRNINQFKQLDSMEQKKQKNVESVDQQNAIFVNQNAVEEKQTATTVGLNQIQQETSSVSNQVISYASSSLGNIDDNFLKEFYSCAVGLELKNARNNINQVRKKFRLIFPTFEYITNESTFGPDYASPIILNRKYYEKNSFPKEILCEFAASDSYFFHTGIISHIKVCVVTQSDLLIDDQSLIYIGSHNFTSAAWGRFEKDYSQLYCTNTELGIVYPPKQGSVDVKQEIINSLSFKFSTFSYSPEQSPFLRSFD